MLHFWFHKLKPRDWFGGGEAVDRQLQARFGRDLAMLSAGMRELNNHLLA